METGPSPQGVWATWAWCRRRDGARGETGRRHASDQAPRLVPRGRPRGVRHSGSRPWPSRPGANTTKAAAWQRATGCGLAECNGLVILTDTETGNGPNLDGSDRRFREDSVWAGLPHTVPHTASPAPLVAGSRAGPRPIWRRTSWTARNPTGTRWEPAGTRNGGHRAGRPRQPRSEPGRDSGLSVSMSTRTRVRGSAPSVSPPAGEFSGSLGRRRSEPLGAPGRPRGDLVETGRSGSARGADRMSTALPIEPRDEPRIGPLGERACHRVASPEEPGHGRGPRHPIRGERRNRVHRSVGLGSGMGRVEYAPAGVEHGEILERLYRAQGTECGGRCSRTPAIRRWRVTRSQRRLPASPGYIGPCWVRRSICSWSCRSRRALRGRRSSSARS